VNHIDGGADRAPTIV